MTGILSDANPSIIIETKKSGCRFPLWSEKEWKQTEIIITPNWTLGVLFLDPFDLLPEYHSEGDNWLKEIAAYYPSTGKLPAKYLKNWRNHIRKIFKSILDLEVTNSPFLTLTYQEMSLNLYRMGKSDFYLNFRKYRTWIMTETYRFFCSSSPIRLFYGFLDGRVATTGQDPFLWTNQKSPSLPIFQLWLWHWFYSNRLL